MCNPVVKIGVISDIHAELDSLRTALQLLDDTQVDHILCAGDLVERGIHGNEVITLLRERSIPCVQGNHDENGIRHARLVATLHAPADDTPALESDSVVWLETLPVTRTFTFAAATVLLAHATPSNNGGPVFHDSNHDALAKRFKKDLARMEADVLLVGHTHFPFDLQYRDKRILNPGSVCGSRSRDSHTCGIIDLTDSRFTVFKLATGKPIDIVTSRFD